eukprot:g19582.t1
MRGSSAMKLLAACCGGLLMSVPVHAKKVYDLRTGNDKGSKKDCETPGERSIEVEVFDYNLNPWIIATYTLVADECGGNDFTPIEPFTFEYKGGRGSGSRLQMDMYICAPFGEYELEIEVKSTNGDDPMNKVAWEIEYGPDQYHLWDTLNTPLFNTRNGATMADVPYAPIPPKYSGSGPGTIYKWPLPKSESYYSTLYTGPFPPTQCPDRYPAGVAYKGCFPRQSGWTDPTPGPAGPTGKYGDEAETERMFDGLGIDDDGLKENGVMTIEKCAGICNEGPYSYMGLQSAVQCVCGNSISGDDVHNCGLEDDLAIPEYQYLCSGDSQVLCGTDTMVSIYSLDGTGPPPTPPTPTSPPTPTPPTSDEYELLGCSEDNVDGNRVMTLGPIKQDTMSAEICLDYCTGLDEGYTYFGTQYGKECWCATTVAGGLTVGHDGCNMTCANNAGEICGGYDAISVYKIGDVGPSPPTPAPVNATPPAPAPVTPTPSGGDGYDLLGCFADAQPGPNGKDVRIMGDMTSSNDMTAEICFGLCNDGTKTHFGTQYGKECWCVYDPELESINQFNDVALPCDYPCTGDATETCGGYDSMTVYVITGDVATAPPTVVDPKPYTQKDCYVDLRDGSRVMEVKMGTSPSSTMSAQICYEMCTGADAGYAYFGLQYSYECWCSTTLSDSETTDGAICEYPCYNNASETCGGLDAIMVYEIN